MSKFLEKMEPQRRKGRKQQKGGPQPPAAQGVCSALISFPDTSLGSENLLQIDGSDENVCEKVGYAPTQKWKGGRLDTPNRKPHAWEVRLFKRLQRWTRKL
jgi:hypothetical protein